MRLDGGVDANKYVDMPAGPGPTGFVYFLAVKYVGYTLFSQYEIRKSVESKSDSPFPSSWLAGAIRTAIGLAVGAVVGIAFWKIPGLNSDRLFDGGLFFLLLVPVRVGEWLLLLHTVYRNFSFRSSTQARLVGGGIVTSFALDAIGVLFAWILPGGMWVC